MTTTNIPEFTTVKLAAHNYAFKDVELKGNEWIELQESRHWGELTVCEPGVAMLVNIQENTYCFIFWDEAAQCSQPYPTVQEALDARKHYMGNL